MSFGQTSSDGLTWPASLIRAAYPCSPSVGSMLQEIRLLTFNLEWVWGVERGCGCEGREMGVGVGEGDGCRCEGREMGVGVGEGDRCRCGCG